MQTGKTLTVYYDGTCPICHWEIGLYAGMKGGERISWLDIWTISESELGVGLTRPEALGKFHARLMDRRLVQGGAAFVEIWSLLHAMRWAAKLGRTAIGRRVQEVAYRVFLRVLPLLRRITGTREAGTQNN